MPRPCYGTAKMRSGRFDEMDKPAHLADGATRVYGIIGDPIAQVKSPGVFNEKFRALGKNAVMIPLHTKPANFDACMRGLKSLVNLHGILVTLPYKNSVIAHADTVLPAARLIGAGGAGSAIADALGEAEAADITVFDRIEEKGRLLVEKITQTHSKCHAKSSEPRVVGKDLLINAT